MKNKKTSKLQDIWDILTGKRKDDSYYENLNRQISVENNRLNNQNQLLSEEIQQLKRLIENPDLATNFRKLEADKLTLERQYKGLENKLLEQSRTINQQSELIRSLEYSLAQEKEKASEKHRRQLATKRAARKKEAATNVTINISKSMIESAVNDAVRSHIDDEPISSNTAIDIIDEEISFAYINADGQYDCRNVLVRSITPYYIKGTDLDKHASRTFRKDRIVDSITIKSTGELVWPSEL